MTKGLGLKKLSKNSYVIFEDINVIVVASGFKRGSSNAKTGHMIQTWILRKDEDPVTASKNGNDGMICGSCPLRRDPVTGKRGCYVQVEKAPLSVWKAYHNGRYARLVDLSVFKGQFVRFGSYGDPVLIPLWIMRAIAKASAGHTGYTHQWHRPLFQAYREFLMASTSARDYLTAQAQGWRTFTVSAEKLDNQVVCPASAEAGHRVSCAQCRLCGGTSKQARSIQIQPHGFGKKQAALAA